MGQYQFKAEFSNDRPIVIGSSGFAQGTPNPMRDTGVYLRPGHEFSRGKVDVILWFHGFYVQNVQDLLQPVDAGMNMFLRESVLNSKKDVVLIAPWLGLKTSSTTGSLGLGALGEGVGCQDYLDQVIAGLVEFRKALSPQASSSLVVENLIIAGHSAGGALMKEPSKHLGTYQERLRECWGFDCFYDNDYSSWCWTNPKPKKVFYFGNGSGAKGAYAYKLMREVYGTLKHPAAKPVPNTSLAPAVDKVFTANDTYAFQPIQDPDDWGAPGHNPYTDVRTATDPYLKNDDNQAPYWSRIYPKLTEHFQVVRDLFGPRVQQSKVL
jgi:hypothetical protein